MKILKMFFCGIILCSAFVLKADEVACPPATQVGVKENASAKFIQRTMKKLEESTKENPSYVRILFYGQSIVAQGWRDDLMKYLKEKYPTVVFDVKSRAIGGFEAGNLIRTAESDLYPFYPDLLFFHVYGELDKYEQIVKNTRERTSAEIVLWTSHLNASQKAEKMLEQRDKRSLAIMEIAKRNSCMVIDLNKKWSEMLLANKWKSSELLRDGIHLNEKGVKYYAGFIAEELVRIKGAEGVAEVSGTITEVPFESDMVKKNSDGSVELTFEGNRVVAIPDGKQLGKMNILLDGKSPAAYPEMYANTRPSTLVMWMPMIRCVERKDGVLPIAQNWELIYTEGTKREGPVAYKVKGSVTGEDGYGRSDEDFVSNSGQVVIKTADFHGNQQYKRFLKNPRFSNNYARVGQKIKWKTYPLHSEMFSSAKTERRVVIVQNCENTKHTLKFIPTKNAKIGISKFVIYKPAK